MRRTIQAAAAGLVLATAGCASAPGGGAGSEPSDSRSVSRSGGPVAPHVDTPLAGTWRLTALTDRGEDVDLPRAQDRIARFERRRVYLDAGCVTLGGTYSARGSRLRLSMTDPVPAIGCLPGPVLRQMVAVQSLADDRSARFARSGGRLTLTSGRYVFTYDRTAAVTPSPDLPRTPLRSS